MKDQHANKPQLLYVMALILCGMTMASAETGFDPRYERDYNIFNPANLYAPNIPLNPANAYDPGLIKGSEVFVSTLVPTTNC